ncbi:hypothetical protein VM98_38920, partial [Streptomyces rubellomurinus subsp. indigoferus]
STYDRGGTQLSAPSVTPVSSTTALTPATGQLPTPFVTTNPLGWTTTVPQDPARGSPLPTTDPNGRLTTAHYDPPGPLPALCSPDPPTTHLPPNPFTHALYP